MADPRNGGAPAWRAAHDALVRDAIGYSPAAIKAADDYRLRRDVEGHFGPKGRNIATMSGEFCRDRNTNASDAIRLAADPVFRWAHAQALVNNREGSFQFSAVRQMIYDNATHLNNRKLEIPMVDAKIEIEIVAGTTPDEYNAKLKEANELRERGKAVLAVAEALTAVETRKEKAKRALKAARNALRALKAVRNNPSATADELWAAHKAAHEIVNA